jgi:putative nucleotidyltransferase with HDIG domain
MSTGIHPEVRKRLETLVETCKLPLPVLPDAVSRVLLMVQRPDCNIEGLAAVVRSDPTLTGHVLRFAGTPQYGGATKIVSLPQLIGRLGFAQMLQISLIVASRARVFEVPGFEGEVRASFRHSFATALFAQEIARTVRTSVEPAFIAGLLHDLGRPLLLQALVDLYRQVGVTPEPAQLLAAADEWHAEVGGALVDRWALAPQVAEAVRKHHAPGGSMLATIVALADTLADGAIEGGAFAAPLNLYPEDVAAIARKSDDIMTMVEAIS